MKADISNKSKLLTNFKKPRNSFEIIRATNFHSLTITKETHKKILGSYLKAGKKCLAETYERRKPLCNNKKTRKMKRIIPTTNPKL